MEVERTPNPLQTCQVISTQNPTRDTQPYCCQTRIFFEKMSSKKFSKKENLNLLSLEKFITQRMISFSNHCDKKIELSIGELNSKLGKKSFVAGFCRFLNRLHGKPPKTWHLETVTTSCECLFLITCTKTDFLYGRNQ